jgi:anaerobic selenocysteine-containing dehydrogenase
MLSRMKKEEVETKQLSSLPCPTCGVGAGMRCVRHSGVARADSHVDRKLSALEAAERKQK